MTPIAIVGMAGRLPGARDLGRFWDNLLAGRESLTRFDAADLRAAGRDPALLDDPRYVPVAGVLDDVECFDAELFGYGAREAELLDPQHRHFLEVAWSALEDAGYDPTSCRVPVGVFAGARLNTYMIENLLPHRERLDELGLLGAVVGNDKDFLATAVSYRLGLTGPAMTVQTACSTSLVATHLACQSLLSGECDMAIAGGAAVAVPHRAGYPYREGGIYSPDGHCRAFSADASGTVGGSGVAAVVLRRLDDALHSGDCIRAVILASAVNNDGRRKVGFTAPSVDGQTQVIAEALALAEVDAGSVGYVEAHGTGTLLGDPIEVAALTSAFRADTGAVGYCGLGSLKSNVGHLDAAAGVAGLIKATLAVQHGIMPPSLHLRTPNPATRLDTSPFFVPTRPAEWRVPGPRRAGVSAFGIGGTNAHLVIEQAPPVTPVEEPAEAGSQLIVVSARTASALAEARERVALAIQAIDAPLADVAATLQSGRTAMRYRAAIVNGSTVDSIADDRPRVVYFFPGQGAHRPGAGRELYATEPVYRAAVDEVAALFRPELDIDLRDLLHADPSDEAAATALASTRYARPALFTIGYALAVLWRHWGIVPDATVGHGPGEYLAATMAGSFELADAVRAVAESSNEEPLTAVGVVADGHGTGVLVEFGPGQTLSTLAATQLPNWTAIPAFGDTGDRAAALHALGTAWCAGVEVDWEAVRHNRPRRAVPLPAYPFERHRHWIDPPAAPDSAVTVDSAPKEVAATADQVTQIWCELLGAAEASPEDDFYDVGGDSLLAAQMLGRLRERCGADLTLDQILATSTLGQLIKLVAGSAPAKIEAGPVRVPRRPEGMPLTHAQQRLWVLEQLDPGTPVYHLPFVVTLHGRLDVPALERALSTVVARHEALRSRFLVHDGVPVQQPAPPSPVTLPVEPPSDLAAEVRRPFDLAGGPPVRFRLWRRSEVEHQLVVCAHHLVLDGWSVGVLVRELAEAYASGTVATPPPLQCADVAVWQRSAPADGLDYWRTTLDGFADEPVRLSPKPRPAMPSGRGGRVTGYLEAAERVRLEAGGGLFSSLLAGLGALLARIGDADRLIIGSPVANRPSPVLESVVGLLANTLPLPVDASGDPTLTELRDRVATTVRAALVHQDVPYEEIVAASTPPDRDPGRNPLFDVLLVLQNAPMPPLRLGELELSTGDVHTGTAKFDLTVDATPDGDRLRLSIEYSADLWDEAAALDLLQRLISVLSRLAGAPDTRLHELPVLDSEVESRLEAWASGGPAYPPALVTDLVLGSAPDAPAVVDSHGTTSYRALTEYSQRIAHHLHTAGVRRGDRVAVCLPRSAASVAALLGVLRAGAAYVPLDLSYPAPRLAQMLAESGAGYLLTDGDPDLPLAGQSVVAMPGPGPVPPGTLEPPGLDDLVYVLFTSGSTGVPKGIGLSHRGLGNLVQWQVERSGGPLRTAQLTPYGFDVHFQEVFGTLAAGGTMVVAPDELRRDPPALLAWLDRERIERLFLPYVALAGLADAARRVPVLPRFLREVVTAGERLQVTDAVRAFFTRLPGCRLDNHYGPAESHAVTAYRLDGDPAQWPALPPVGRPLPGMRCDVYDRSGARAIAGELVIGGVQLANGYVNDAGANARRFVGGRYRTGDLVRWLPDGELDYHGRADDQVKIRGHRVEPAEIESVLSGHSGVRECAVVAEPGPDGRARLIGYVAGTATEPELRDWLVRRLPAHLVPARLVPVPQLPRTPSGKVDRRRLATVQPAQQEAPPPAADPRTRLVAETLSGVLATPVGPDDDFFALGGDSILAIALAARLTEAGLTVTPRVIFAHPTAAGLAEYLGSAPTSSPRQIADRLLRRPGPAPHRTHPFELRAAELVLAGEDVLLRRDTAVDCLVRGMPRPDTLADAVRRVKMAPPLETGIEAATATLVTPDATPSAPVALDPADVLVPQDFPLLDLTEGRLRDLITSLGIPEDAYPVTPMQHTMLAHLAEDGRPGLFSVRTTDALPAFVDPAALREAFGALVARHPILRTSFPASDRGYVQWVHPTAELPWTEWDWRRVPPDELRPRLDQLLADDFVAPFELTRPPLARCTLIRLRRGYQLIFTAHHLLLDGWSRSLLLADVPSLYARAEAARPLPVRARTLLGQAPLLWRLGPAQVGALARAQRAVLPPPPPPPSEHVRALANDDPAAALRYWDGYLRACDSAAIAPPARHTDPDGGYRRRLIAVPQSTVDALAELGRGYGVTTAAAAQAAWAAVLARRCRSTEVMFGVTSSGRRADVPGYDRMVGLFITTLPLRVRLRPDETVAELLRRVQYDATAARAAEQIPLHELEQRQGRRLCGSVVVIDNFPQDAAQHELAALLRAGHPFGADQDDLGMTEYPLRLEVIPVGGLYAALCHHRDEYGDLDAAGLLDDWAHALASIAADPGRPVAEL